MPRELVLPKIRRRRSKLHGFGVFALEPINKNKRIIDYAGELITNKQSESREDRYLRKGCIWVFRVNRNWSRDANVDGNVARFINHSCRPELLGRGRRQDDLDSRRAEHQAWRRADLRLQHRGRQDDPLPLSSRVQDQAVRFRCAAQPSPIGVDAHRDRWACRGARRMGRAARGPARPGLLRPVAAELRSTLRERDPRSSTRRCCRVR